MRTWWFGALLAACAAPSPRSAPHSSDPPVAEPRLSAEWLAVVGSDGEHREQDCQQVLSVIVGDSRCVSTACRHATRLANDWVAHCRAIASGSRAAEVERLSIVYEHRATQPPDACVDRAEGWLRDGCGEHGACKDQAREWVARCARATGSPLLVLMLERTIERSLALPGSAAGGGQSCRDLGTELGRAANCDPKSDCEESLRVLDRYRQTCRAGKLGPMGAAEGLAELSILEGAGKSPPPLPISNEPSDIGAVPLALVGGSGAVLRVCGKRVVDLGQYLEQRRQCTDGDLLVAKIVGDREQRMLKLAILPHPNDEAFARRLPSLLVAGERERRDQTLLASLTAALDSIVGRKTETEGLRGFCRFLARLGPSLHRSEAVLKLLEDRDAVLGSMFADLGRRKRAVVLATLTAPARYAFAARALALPLSDVDAEGAVAVGAMNPVADLELDSLLPRSVAAYRAELGALGKPRIEPRDEQVLAAEVVARTDACRAALDAAGRLERTLLDCAFGPGTCDGERRQALGKELDDARTQADRARILTGLSLAYVPRAARDAARREAFAEGACAR
jgi:hypothetical protein